jgi:fatty-acyl-CoA synthase
MKLSFSTLGCPDFSWTDIYSMAKDLGFDGIEIRGLGSEIYAVKARPFRESELAQTVATLKKLHLEIPCLSADCTLKYKEQAEDTRSEICSILTSPQKLETPYIRILGD